MNDTILIALGVLLVIDLALDLIRLWTQNTLEAKLTNVEKNLKQIQVDLNGKAQQVLDLAVATADQLGYKRARDEQAVIDVERGTVKTVTTETTIKKSDD